MQVRYLPYYVPGAKPLFVENDTFKTEIPLVFATLADHAVKLFKWRDLPVLNEEKLQQELINIPLPSSLAGKHWEEIILHLVPSLLQTVYISTRLYQKGYNYECVLVFIPEMI